MFKYKYIKLLPGIITLLYLTFSPSLSSADTSLLQDDFTGTTIDTLKWTETDSSSGGSGGSLGNVRQNGTLTVVGNGSFGVNTLKSVSTFDRTAGDVNIDVDITPTDCGASGAFAVVYGEGAVLTTDGTSYLLYYNGGRATFTYYNNGTALSSQITTFVCTNGVQFHAKIAVLKEGGASVYFNNSGTASATITGGTFTNKSVVLQNTSSSQTATFDNLLITTPDIVVGQPTGLYATPASGQVTLNWTAPLYDGGSAITDYIVEYKLASVSSWSTYSDGVGTGTTATLTGLTNGSGYNFRVRAVNGLGTGNASTVVTSIPINGTVLLYDNFNTNTIDSLKWNEVDSAGGGSGSSVGNVTVTGGQLRIANGTGSFNGNELYSVNTFDRGNQDLDIQADITYTSCSNSSGYQYGPATGGGCQWIDYF